MTELTTSTQPSKWWKRPLIGGLFSMVAVIINTGIVFAFPSLAKWPDFLVPFGYLLAFLLFSLFLGVTAPAELMGLREGRGFPGIIPPLVILIFWFLAGALIAYMDKNTKRASIWWILLLVVLTFIIAGSRR